VFERVTLHVSDLETSTRFYETVLRTITPDWPDFALEQASGADQVTRGLHIGFGAPSHAEVDEFWRVGTEAGYRDDGEPGPRPEYGDDYYGSFLLDPDGNSAEAVHHDDLNATGAVDHVWIRVADVAAARTSYEGLPRIRVGTDTPGRVQFEGEHGGSFSLVLGEPTENLDMRLRGG
jgi:predicted lactoylglutathione lyase